MLIFTVVAAVTVGPALTLTSGIADDITGVEETTICWPTVCDVPSVLPPTTGDDEAFALAVASAASFASARALARAASASVLSFAAAAAAAAAAVSARVKDAGDVRTLFDLENLAIYVVLSSCIIVETVETLPSVLDAVTTAGC